MGNSRPATHGLLTTLGTAVLAASSFHGTSIAAFPSAGDVALQDQTITLRLKKAPSLAADYPITVAGGARRPSRRPVTDWTAGSPSNWVKHLLEVPKKSGANDAAPGADPLEAAVHELAERRGFDGLQNAYIFLAHGAGTTSDAQRQRLMLAVFREIYDHSELPAPKDSFIAVLTESVVRVDVKGKLYAWIDPHRALDARMAALLLGRFRVRQAFSVLNTTLRDLRDNNALAGPLIDDIDSALRRVESPELKTAKLTQSVQALQSTLDNGFVPSLEYVATCLAGAPGQPDEVADLEHAFHAVRRPDALLSSLQYALGSSDPNVAADAAFILSRMALPRETAYRVLSRVLQSEAAMSLKDPLAHERLAAAFKALADQYKSDQEIQSAFNQLIADVIDGRLALEPSFLLSTPMMRLLDVFITASDPAVFDAIAQYIDAEALSDSVVVDEAIGVLRENQRTGVVFSDNTLAFLKSALTKFRKSKSNPLKKKEPPRALIRAQDLETLLKHRASSSSKTPLRAVNLNSVQDNSNVPRQTPSQLAALRQLTTTLNAILAPGLNGQTAAAQAIKRLQNVAIEGDSVLEARLRTFAQKAASLPDGGASSADWGGLVMELNERVTIPRGWLVGPRIAAPGFTLCRISASRLGRIRDEDSKSAPESSAMVFQGARMSPPQSPETERAVVSLFGSGTRYVVFVDEDALEKAVGHEEELLSADSSEAKWLAAQGWSAVQQAFIRAAALDDHQLKIEPSQRRALIETQEIETALLRIHLGAALRTPEQDAFVINASFKGEQAHKSFVKFIEASLNRIHAHDEWRAILLNAWATAAGSRTDARDPSAYLELLKAVVSEEDLAFRQTQIRVARALGGAHAYDFVLSPWQQVHRPQGGNSVWESSRWDGKSFRIRDSRPRLLARSA